MIPKDLYLTYIESSQRLTRHSLGHSQRTVEVANDIREGAEGSRSLWKHFLSLLESLTSSLTKGELQSVHSLLSQIPLVLQQLTSLSSGIISSLNHLRVFST